MALDNDDFFGGFFDLNGDGKTDAGEQFVAYKFLEDIEKGDNSDKEEDSLFSRRHTASAPKPPLPKVMIPERLTLSEYKRWRRAIIEGAILSSLLLLPLLILPGIVIWATFSAFEPGSGASLLVTGVFTLIGLIGVGLILAAIAANVNDSGKQLEEAKAAYLKQSEEERLTR